jgi:hypothetical protein
MLVMKLLAKEAGERYQSARGLRHDLEKAWKSGHAHGRIELFALGERDVADRFQIPRRLYGREQEVASALAAFRGWWSGDRPSWPWCPVTRASASRRWCTSCKEPIVRQHGFFAAGKFDQWKRDIPYSTIVQAFTEVVLEILAGSQERIATWRGRIQEALGVNGQLHRRGDPSRRAGDRPAASPAGPAADRVPEPLPHRLPPLHRVFASEQHPLALVPRRSAVGRPGQSGLGPGPLDPSRDPAPPGGGRLPRQRGDPLAPAG